MTAVDEAARVVQQALESRVFPAATAEIGSSAGPLWQRAFGRLTFDSEAAPTTLDTWFDLASLTKVLATASVVMELIGRGQLDLEEPLTRSFPEWRGLDRESVTVRDLLEHTSGLPARLLDAPPLDRREFEHDICTMPLEYEPRSRSIYSDLGFILLGFLAHARAREGFGILSDLVALKLGSRVTWARGKVVEELLPDLPRPTFAPTLPLQEDSRRGRLLVGEVHDSYAAVLVAAGHAGLFGRASDVGIFGRVLLRAARGDDSAPPPFTPACVSTFTMKSAVAGSSRALGWDTMLPTSSCGTRMSAAAFGHVGFTGTSLWIDPARDRYYVLLTNRACGGGSLDAMRAVRRAFHDALADI